MLAVRKGTKLALNPATVAIATVSPNGTPSTSEWVLKFLGDRL